MRVLWLSPYLPVPYFGGGTRVFNLIQALSASCDVELIAATDAWPSRSQAVSAVSDLRSWCRNVEVVVTGSDPRQRRRLLQLRSLASPRSFLYWTTYSHSMQASIDRAFEAATYDVVILEHSFMGYYSLPEGTPTVLDQHNLESEIFLRAGRRERSRIRRVYNLIEYVKYRVDERRICRKVDLILATSERDCEAMGKWTGLPPCFVIPNGVDTSHFAPPENLNMVDQPAGVLFTGTMRYSPNVEAILYFTSAIWPLVRRQNPDASFTIVGGAPPTEIRELGRLPGVTVTGYVPDVREYLARAAVVVAPLRIGGGTRLKILEALAMERAVVSTSLGCEGLRVRDGRELLVADEPDEFAARVMELLSRPDLQAKLGRQGRRLVEDLYDWHSLGLRMEVVLQDLAQRTGKQMS